MPSIIKESIIKYRDVTDINLSLGISCICGILEMITRRVFSFPFFFFFSFEIQKSSILRIQDLWD